MKFPRVIKTRRGKLDFGELDVVIRRFIRYVRPHRGRIAVAAAATFGVVLMHLAAPWPIKFIFDIVLSHRMAHTTVGRWFAHYLPTPGAALLVICAGVMLIAAADAILVYLRDVLLAQTGQRVVGKLRHDLFRHMQRLAPDVFESRRTGDLLMRLTADMQMLRQMLVNSWIKVGENVFGICAITVVMFWLNPLLAAVAIAMMPLAAWASTRIARSIRHATKAQRERESFVMSIAHEVLGAMMLVQAFNREKIELQRFARQNRGSIRAGVRTTRLESKLYRIVSLSSAAGLCAVLYFGVRAVLAGSMTPGDLLVFVAYLRSLHKPLRKLTKLASTTAKATACGMRIAEIFEIPPGVTDQADAVAASNVIGKIELEGVGFVYPDGTRALQGVSMVVEPGQRIAVVGASGAGKSTIMKLLLRFYDPTSGTIRLDDKDIRTLTLSSLRDQIAIVHQGTVLFGLTVKENIALGYDDIDFSAVQEAARKVGADEFIMELPKGYDTLLSERGETLSGGQRQRLALARALLRPTPVLILDEPVTGLDARSANVAERTWMDSQTLRTTIVICHDLSAMERFDRIFVLDRGWVVDSGTHDQLLARCDAYASLHGAWRFRCTNPMITERDPHAYQTQ